ncbi:MAG: hypothetical protein ABIU54_14825 [Candidatus Eisenbacteria bacterium]
MTALSPHRIAPAPAVALWPRFAAVMVCMVAFAVLLDAWDRPVPTTGMLWLDLVAVLTLGWSLLAPGAPLKLDSWVTPFDGRVFAALALAILDLFHTHGEGTRIAWLHQMLSATVCYYALVARLRHQPRGPDLLWLPFGIVAFVLGLRAVVSMTSGIVALARAADLADAAWAADFGVAKTLVFATIVCAGRASEQAAPPYWRFATWFGAVGCVLHGLAGGIPLETHALMRLNEPMYFSTMVVTLLVLIPLTRSAWLLRRERADEAPRWAGLAMGFATVAFMGVLGGATGGEGVRVLAVLGGAAVVVGTDAPKPLAPIVPALPTEKSAERMSRAA